MKKQFFLLIMALSLTAFVGCDYDDEFTPPNYVTFERVTTANVGVAVGTTSTHTVTVYTGNITSNDRTFDLVANSSSTLEAAGYELPATVTIPGGTNEGTFTVEVADMNLGLAGKKLVINLAESEDLTAGGSYTINVSRTCAGTGFTIDFEFDGYASETTWILEDAEGNELVTGGGYTDGTATASRTLCLDQGTYTFTVMDAYGDGLTYPNVGSITISYAGEVLEVIDGDFGAETSVEVTF